MDGGLDGGTSQCVLSHDSLHLLSALCVHAFDKWFLSAKYDPDTF